MWKTATLLVTCVLVLVTLGVVMLGSASQEHALSRAGDPWYFVKRQLVSLLIGLVVAFGVARVDYSWWRKAPVVLGMTALAVVLLVLALVPGVGLAAKGSSRWVKLGFLSFQPSEFAKFSVIVLLAWWMARVQRRTADLVAGLLVPVGSLAVILGLIFIEPDFGTTLVIAVVGLTMLFAGGARIGYLVVVTLLGLIGFSAAVMADKERLARLIAFLNPWEHAEDEAYQLVNAIYAFVAGGPWGEGLGHGLQKHCYLPEAHTDFIFAIIGEELGLVASLATVAFFFGIFMCGMAISLKAPDDFGRLLGFGLTLMITIQAAINMGVVTGCLPTKGLALPFISFGGSNLIVSLAMVGVLLNLAQHAVPGGRWELRAVKDQTHRL